MKINKNLLKNILSLDIFSTFGVKIYLIIIFIIVSTTPVIMLGIIQYKFIDNNIISIMEKNNLLEVKDFSGKIELFTDMNARIIKLASQQLENDEQKIKTLFTNIFKVYSDFQFICYENEKGEIFIYDGIFYKTDKFRLKLGKNDFIQLAKHQKSLFFTGKIKLFPDKKAVIGIITPVFTGNKGYLFAGLKLDKITDYIETISRKKGEVIILDSVSNSVIYPEVEKGNFIQSSQAILAQNSSNNSGLIKDFVSDIGIQKIVSYKKIDYPEFPVGFQPYSPTHQLN